MRTRRSLLLAVPFLLAAPASSLADPPQRVRRIGILSSRGPFSSLDEDLWGETIRGLAELGYVPGKNLAIDWRFAEGSYGRLPALANELVRIPVDLIMADGTPPTLAAARATSSIPIVFTSVGDPVSSGVVRSLARPGGNVTGISIMGFDTPVKQLEMLNLLAPGLRRVAVLVNPTNPAHTTVRREGAFAAARIPGLETIAVEARSPEELERAFATIAAGRLGAVMWLADLFFSQQRNQISALAARYRIPAIGPSAFADAGGLLGYGPSYPDNYRRAAKYVEKILRGASPAELPVEQPTRFELVINLKTANVLGLAIPPELLVLANRVIE